jgi:TFIIF, beta subunit N-terminus
MTSAESSRSMDDAFEDDADPDLDISKVKDRVWLVKLPKWLMEHWAKTDEDNVELAGIHIPYVPFCDCVDYQDDIQWD